MSRDRYIDCASCGDKVKEGASCENCTLWREEHDARVTALQAKLALAVEALKIADAAITIAYIQDWSCESLRVLVYEAGPAVTKVLAELEAIEGTTDGK